MSPDLTAILQSTYLGGTGNDCVYACQIGIHPQSGEIFVLGDTSGGLPAGVVADGYQSTYGGGSYDNFVVRLNAALTARRAGTYLGGSGYDAPFTLAVAPDSSTVYLTGFNSGGGFPTVNAQQGTFAGGGDGFVSRLSTDLTAVNRIPNPFSFIHQSNVPPNSVRTSNEVRLTITPTPPNNQQTAYVTNAVGSEANQSQIRALFVTDSNAPVKNIRVYFDLAGDQNSIGGTFNTGTTLVYSDANGVATSTYIPAQRSSPTDGLTVRACWDYADFTPPACPHSATTTLTVIDDPVSVTIGTDGTLEIGPSGLTYVKRYVVQVVDSSGLAKPDVQVTPSIDLVRYRKGTWELAGDVWAQFPTAVCDNEDINRNNILEVYSNGGVEDANGNGKLDPRKADVSITFEGSSKSNSDGQVIVKTEYPQNLGSWVDFDILVTAGGVTSTEGRAHFKGTLPVLAKAVNDKSSVPAFRISPYGTLASPTTVVTSPEGKSASLCTNPN